jgi:hypothetical protein
MESRQSERPTEIRGDGQTAPPRTEQRERRFRIVKLEERIAPGTPHNGHYYYGPHGHSYNKRCGF